MTGFGVFGQTLIIIDP